ncbi:hypothetical protein QP938_13070 [Porticoccaceae bacterium LTM1]|nr:hypothetical protein QP938_13070 [Porticoccaceae bacterium LTM1]
MNLLDKTLFAALVLSAFTVQAQDWKFSGESGVEGRFFPQKPRQIEQQKNLGVSIMMQPEFRYQASDRKTQLGFVPFFRYDAEDRERTHFDLREAYWRQIGDEWEVTVGVDKVFWGVAESRHLVDVINQTDAVEDPDQEDKLGQPMMAATTQKEWGALSLYWLPYFRERTFPGEDGRFRTQLPVNSRRAEYESGAEQWHQDFAVRYSHYLGDWDIGGYYFYGTSREPRFIVDDNEHKLVSLYDVISQVGIDLQYTNEAWLWKLEAISRKGQGKTFFASVAGLEYTFYQIMESDSDLGLLVEYQYDGRDSNAPDTLADNDLFVGLRWSLNDISDTAILAGVSVDRITGEQFYNIEAERRIDDHITAELRARFLTGSEVGEPSWFLERDDYIQLSVLYHF